MTPTCRKDGSCGVQNPRTPQRDVGKDFRWVSVDPALSLSLLYSLAWICLAIDSGKGIPHNTNLGTRCSWNLSFGEVTSFLTQGPLCPILPYFVSRFPSCINQADGLLSVRSQLGPMGPLRLASIPASRHSVDVSPVSPGCSGREGEDESAHIRTDWS